MSLRRCEEKSSRSRIGKLMEITLASKDTRKIRLLERVSDEKKEYLEDI